MHATHDSPANLVTNMSNLDTPFLARGQGTNSGVQQHLTPKSITAELLKPTDYLVCLDPNTVVQADIFAAETGMVSLLRSVQGADRNAFRQVFREYNPFNVSLINAVTYFWRLQAINGILITKPFSEHVVAILDVLFHRNNPRVKLQAMVFVRAIMLTTHRFQPLPQKTDGINTPFCVILVKLLEWFDPLGPPIIQERIDGRDVPLRERDLFTGLKDSIIDVMKKLPESCRFWLNTQNEFNAILVGKYREYWNGMKNTTAGTESRGLWTTAFHAIEDIQAATKGHSGRY